MVGSLANKLPEDISIINIGAEVAYYLRVLLPSETASDIHSNLLCVKLAISYKNLQKFICQLHE